MESYQSQRGVINASRKLTLLFALPPSLKPVIGIQNLLGKTLPLLAMPCFCASAPPDRLPCPRRDKSPPLDAFVEDNGLVHRVRKKGRMREQVRKSMFKQRQGQSQQLSRELGLSRSVHQPAVRRLCVDLVCLLTTASTLLNMLPDRSTRACR